jgi:hypothetical protein
MHRVQVVPRDLWFRAIDWCLTGHSFFNIFSGRKVSLFSVIRLLLVSFLLEMNRLVKIVGNRFGIRIVDEE